MEHKSISGWTRHLVACACLLLMTSTGCVTGPTPKDIKQAEIQYDLGVNDMRNGRLADAMKNFMEVVSVNPDFPEAQYALGLTYFMLGNNDKALAHYEKALELKPDYSEVRNNMARIYISEGKYRTAIEILRKALEDVFLKERFLAESNLGWALFHIGEEETGFRHVRNALALNENYCVGYEYLGLMHQSKKRYDEAIREFQELVKRCPRYPQGHRALGKVMLMAGDVVNGCKALRACQEQSRMTEVGSDCDRLLRTNCPSKPEGAENGDKPDSGS